MDEDISNRYDYQIDNLRINNLILSYIRSVRRKELKAILAFHFSIPEEFRDWCTAERLESKTLLVKTKHSAFSQELIQRKETIIENVNRITDKDIVEDIRVYG